MRALHVFAGAGGSVLAGRMLGWESVGCVEWDPYCRRVLRARGERVVGCDVRGFKATGLAGRVDIVVGGSPCQDLSVAGRGAGLSGERSGLWWEQLRIARECEAPFIWWENVRGALSSNGGRDFGCILNSLADAGYDARWTVNRASDVGAPHRRERVWLLAYRPEHGRSQGGPGASERARQGGQSAGRGERVANPSGRELPQRHPEQGGQAGLPERPAGRGGKSGLDVANAGRGGDERRGDVGDVRRAAGSVESDASERERGGDAAGGGDSAVAHANGAGLEGREPGGRCAGERAAGSGGVDGGWRSAQPGMGGTPDGVANGLDWPAARGAWPHGKGPTQAAWEAPRTVGKGEHGRIPRLKALGNGWVPAQAVAAWRELWGEA